ncbi:hypothetical protein VIOR3934_16581 [Vibrio orientalis CIP 102891 = ATCC 33934]|uniref:DUF4145 domain-containing protein n=1 Tax=Vibrio orientalis CIP 102891 = ATCC 33934 TaxID=675816 RepID=C9QKH3_VIBOR|nr:DUF4145 domain-containing protein [Vibrio orientalis]EEX92168.1 hypothetical protein VIA_002812 [Vibrio orientalis CIP 102891 = ATCC 33934]EGU46898.1 hypothetical protein VIOR3934_16581 [Vibrio orientalis CIP 102891 = ATCC 33934]
MNSKYYPPLYGNKEFHCPSCNVFARQGWAHLQTLTEFSWRSVVDRMPNFKEQLSSDWVVSKCSHCQDHIIWHKQKMIFPKSIPVQHPNPDLDQEIIEDYLEAANVFNDSPRAAAALLRLALQKLCKQLGEKGDNINQDIKNLVKKGLNPLVQKSLDSLRITGNNAVHPGEINLDDEPQRVLKLFDLLNFIATKMITEPKEIESFYDDLPDPAKESIEKRDNKVTQ